MTQAEVDMMERIHIYGKFYQLNDENMKLALKMIKELLQK